MRLTQQTGLRQVKKTADDFGFRNVGQVFNTADGFFNSGVYLGNGWVLSAYHPVRNGSGGFQFGVVLFRDTAGNEVPFSVDPSSGCSITGSGVCASARPANRTRRTAA